MSWADAPGKTYDIHRRAWKYGRVSVALASRSDSVSKICKYLSPRVRNTAIDSIVDRFTRYKTYMVFVIAGLEVDIRSSFQEDRDQSPQVVQAGIVENAVAPGIQSVELRLQVGQLLGKKGGQGSKGRGRESRKSMRHIERSWSQEMPHP